MSIVIQRSIPFSKGSSRIHQRVCFRRNAIELLGENAPLAVGAGVALFGLSAAYVISDPQKRRDSATEKTGGSEKDSVRDYFNGDGFDRWRRIYGSTDDVNDVQKDIREGHAITIEKTLNWLTQDKGKTIVLLRF